MKLKSTSYPIKFGAWELGYPGLIPASFHVDGVEFFTNAEYVVWSMSSGIAIGNVLTQQQLFFCQTHVPLKSFEKDREK